MIKCAEEGDAVSQYLVGEIYFLGKEIPKDYTKSFNWTSKAAVQGEKGAQAKLGFDYYNGWGTPKNLVLAYKWWSLASVGNDDRFLRKNLEDLESELSPSELAAAQKAATDFSSRNIRKK
jgi:TPR repeat protein